VEKKEPFNGFLTCTKTDKGYRINYNVDKIHALAEQKLAALSIDWFAYGTCVFGIRSMVKDCIVIIEGNKALLRPPYEILRIQIPGIPNDAYAEDTVVSYADIHCKENFLDSVVQRLSRGQETLLKLHEKNEQILIDDHVILTTRSKLQKNLLKILSHQQKNSSIVYTSFEKLAEQLEKKYGFVIDDLHNQIYKTLYDLQNTIVKKVPNSDRNSVIEFGKSFNDKGHCRINPSVFVAI